MPRWGAERRARPLHEVPAASVLPKGGKEKGRAPHLFSMRILHAPIGAPPPFFLREEFFGDAFCLAFLGVSKTRVRSGIARTDRRMSQKNILQRTSGHFQRTSGYGAATIHAKLSG